MDKWLCCCVGSASNTENVTLVPDNLVVPEASSLYPVSSSFSPQFPKVPKAGVIADLPRETEQNPTEAASNLDTARSAVSVNSMSPEEKEVEKSRLQKLVKDFAKEVDQPAVQSRKKEKVATIPNLSFHGCVHFVPVDFSCQKVNEELAHAPGYDPKAKTLIILEGVSQYIPGDAVATTVKAMDSICGPGSSFFLSYVDERINSEPAKLGNPKAVQKIMAMAGSVGEPWINFYSQSAIPGFFESCSSFRVVSDVSTDDISRTSFPAARQLTPDKLMTAERYAVARK